MAVEDRADCIVIGAGVVGLAVARELALRGREVLVLERDERIGSHTSSRNSEVIHAGIYYSPGSLKARLCVDGRRALYAYCEARRVPCRRTGKLIIAANEDEITGLEGIRARAAANGVDDLLWLDEAAVRDREPFVRCHAALWSPSTGIVDSHALMVSLQGDIESRGGHVVCRTAVRNVRAEDKEFIVQAGTRDDYRIRSSVVINAAGLWAPGIAARVAGLSADDIPQQYFAKAHYFSYTGAAPFTTLVYPLPQDGGLGIHATVDMAGQVRFGPDVLWTDAIDYGFDESRRAAFGDAIRRYFPALQAERLAPDYTGIRPKLSGPGEPPGDFVLQSAREHGIPGLVNLFGIESPGLTAALAIGGRVADLLEEQARRRN